MQYSELRLQKAIYNQEFMPFYQPFVCCHDKIIGCEILARWLSPSRGLLSAKSFIESVESSNLTSALTRCLCAEVMSGIPAFLSLTSNIFLLTLNTSLSQIMNPLSRVELLELNSQLRHAGVYPVFEVTEREDIHAFPDAPHVFDELLSQGVKFAVDDFGSGFAGEALLQATQATIIKIDRKFISGTISTVASTFIDKTLNLARISGAKVIAEGVETLAQAEHLRTCGVDYMQGYYFGAPMSLSSFQNCMSQKSLT
ncbi:EAL domain-containing protein [Citrobacter freundii]|jgi:EAL domain-containing protein (putative c-di-GMP-specific phosphodiesterase class I)|uniref:EAL domain-containing protein n=1 Tax=Citrobacter freundii TaxID=546 RepID=UPI000F9ECBD5|nr:EAL domain-containing protein [Citrobacter freundii]QLO41203.1 EAL domain-containing protein [Citrobacter freundii]QLS04645.1 EAL domain-containing protein [Citrobacter freundii]QLV39368.1 EAL domain-containing protein [Citrobacter freundii]QMB04623.1 EAL domain-containing protein [Citrobacter freundii]